MRDTPGATPAPLIQLAPMEGVLDWILREMLSDVGGVDRMVTEFVRVTDRLLPDHVFHRYCPELNAGGRTRAGVPTYVQLLGGQPAWVAANARRAAGLGALGIDLNFGCPARTVNRHDGGAALLREPRRVYDVTRAVREAVPAQIPVTAKVRLGFDHKDFRRDIARAAADAGAASLVVHARTKTEMYTPPAHWAAVADMAEGLGIPVLANGEIWTVDDYVKCRAESGCARVALGRGLVRRPTLAADIRAHLDREAGRPPADPPNFSRPRFLKRFVAESLGARGDAYAIARLKQLLRYWQPVDEVAALWFTRAKVFTRVDEVQSFLDDLSEESPCPKSKSTPGPIAPSASAPRVC